MSVSDSLHPMHRKKTLNAMKVPRAVKRITFKPFEVSPGETLCVLVPKVNDSEVLVPGSLALCFDIDLSGGLANNFLLQNVARALVDKMFVTFAGEAFEDTDDYNIYRTFGDLSLPGEKRDNMVPCGIESENLCKIRSNSGNKNTSGVAAENRLTRFMAASIGSISTITS